MFESLRANLEIIKNNNYFEATVVGVILLSALIVGVDSYHLSKGSEIVRTIDYLSFFIGVFYIFEIIVRVFSEKRTMNFINNPWNIIDFIIIAISLIPIENSELALLGRVVRIFRVLRVIVIIPDLRVLLGSIFKALPQIGFVVLLMFMIFYVYAAIGSALFEEVNPDLWGNISIALLTLFRIMTFEDWTDVMYETMSHPEGSVYSWIYYLSFIFLTAFAFLNMIIGIIVNVMEEERDLLYAESHANEPSMSDLQNEIGELKEMISSLKIAENPAQAIYKTVNDKKIVPTKKSLNEEMLA